MIPANLPNQGRRRVPRRAFEGRVGILLHGVYQFGQSFQVGEAGMMLSCPKPLKIGELMAVSFFLPNGSIVIVRGEVRSLVPAKKGEIQKYGIEFVGLEFQMRREIRNFVAAATRLDGHLQTG